MNMSKIENAVNWMINTANDNSHGYDQKYRWGEKGDYDCSSAVITAWESAGVPVKTNGATYTGNMLNVFKRSGFSDITHGINLKKGSGLKRGDVLLTRGRHTAMYIGDGKIVQASINEKGKATGGAPGDQTGKEFWITSYYNYPWEYVLRYLDEPEHPLVNSSYKTTPNKTNEMIAREVIRGLWGYGSNRKRRLRNAGYNPEEIQKIVNKIMLG